MGDFTNRLRILESRLREPTGMEVRVATLEQEMYQLWAGPSGNDLLWVAYPVQVVGANGLPLAGVLLHPTTAATADATTDASGNATVYGPAGSVGFDMSRARFLTSSAGASTPGVVTVVALTWDTLLYTAIPGQAVVMKLAVDVTDHGTGHTFTATFASNLASPTNSYTFPGGGGCPATGALTLSYSLALTAGGAVGGYDASVNYPSVNAGSGCPGGGNNTRVGWPTLTTGNPETASPVLTWSGLTPGPTIYSGTTPTLTAVEH